MLDKMLKLRNKKGFTLMEMLIVVAIIAVLVAIAIPTFNSSMKKAQDGVDLANARALFAAVQLEAMTNGELTGVPTAGAASITFGEATYDFNSTPTIAYTAATKTNEGSWVITTVPQNSAATPAQTFTAVIPANAGATA